MGTCGILITAIIGIVAGALLAWVIGELQQRRVLHKLKEMVKDRQHVCLNEEFLITQILAENIQKEGYSPDVIFAVCPGGAMIAEWLSRRFLGGYKRQIQLRSIWIETKRSSDGVTSSMCKVREENIDQVVSGLSKTDKVLLVNDISRSGLSLMVARDFLYKFFPEDNVKTAALFYHVDTRLEPTFSAIKTDRTVRFDWRVSRTNQHIFA